MLTVTIPIYLLIIFGYVAVKWRIFPREGMQYLGLFVIRFALPCLLFKVLSHSDIDDVLNGRFLVAYAVGSVIAFTWGWFGARKESYSFRALRGAGMSISNTGFIGAPIVIGWLGPSVSTAFALAIMVENLLILPLTLILAERSPNKTGSLFATFIQTTKQLMINPLIIAIFAGFICAVYGIVLPSLINRMLDMLAATSGALALTVIGGALVGLKTNGLKTEVSKVVFGKLIIQPLAIAMAVFILIPDQPILCAAAIALAAMPMMSVYPILGQKYQYEGFCAAALLITTITSFFTLLGLVWFLNHTLLQ